MFLFRESKEFLPRYIVDGGEQRDIKGVPSVGPRGHPVRRRHRSPSRRPSTDDESVAVDPVASRFKSNEYRANLDLINF